MLLKCQMLYNQVTSFEQTSVPYDKILGYHACIIKEHPISECLNCAVESVLSNVLNMYAVKDTEYIF